MILIIIRIRMLLMNIFLKICCRVFLSFQSLLLVSYLLQYVSIPALPSFHIFIYPSFYISIFYLYINVYKCVQVCVCQSLWIHIYWISSHYYLMLFYMLFGYKCRDHFFVYFYGYWIICLTSFLAFWYIVHIVSTIFSIKVQVR